MPLHLIIAHAHPAMEGYLPPPGALPNLTRLLSRLTPDPLATQDEDCRTPPHERLLAQILGLPDTDGAIPWAAWRMRHDGNMPAEGVWAEVTPAHWEVGMSQIRMNPSDDLNLTVDESRALFEAVQPLFTGPACELLWHAPLTWYARNPAFAGLSCFSLDLAMGRDITDLQPEGPGAGDARRLQNEVQMLLYTHPVNQAREASGKPTINTFWLSGCGQLGPNALNELPANVRYDARLRSPRLHGDPAAWLDAWRALDVGPLGDAWHALERGDSEIELTLCGDRAARTWRFRAGRWPAWLQRWRRHVDPAQMLAQL